MNRDFTNDSGDKTHKTAWDQRISGRFLCIFLMFPRDFHIFPGENVVTVWFLEGTWLTSHHLAHVK